METKFNSQICTTKEQSERLIALGLKKETADMWRGFLVGGETLVPTEEVDLYNFYVEPTPAWSLHRLIEMMCPKGWIMTWQFADNSVLMEFCEETESLAGLYDEVIDCIKTLIETNEFNKEYLV